MWTVNLFSWFYFDLPDRRGRKDYSGPILTPRTNIVATRRKSNNEVSGLYKPTLHSMNKAT